jgi:hypothetical protein
MMPTFIANRIIAAANVSLEAGQQKYRVYFINTSLYLKYKPDVDTILETTDSDQYPNGYGECIVTE